ncbi:cytochrome P450 82A3 [Arachis hypogaea]|uniref:cytochrome P450 82A3 n=1 Tax=Arachis hypogaea TaxID=3818 RepID=UPI000DEC06E5|nr:cytochrome P450 82A3 [Arachis hypogaea]
MDLVVAIGILSLTILLCFLLFHCSKVCPMKEPPLVAGALPILGHLLLFHGSQPLHITLGAMADKYGPLFTIKLGSTKIVVLSNSEMAKECFTKNDKAASSRPKLIAIENLSYNQAMFGFASYDLYWREMRKIVTSELLSNRRMELLRDVRVSEVQASTKELLGVWSTKKDESGYVLVDIKQWFAELTFNMVLRMIAGKRFFGVMKSESEEKAQRCVKCVKDLLRLFGVITVGDAIPSLRWLDIGGHEKAMKEIAKELDKILTEWLDEHLQMMDLGKKDANEQDFIDVLLSVVSDAKIDTFDADTIIKATILNMIIGATETTSITMTWAMCLLLKNPHTLENAKEELEKEIGKERCVSESDTNKLIYLQAIIKETLRLYPPAPLTATHEFSENCTLGGYHIEKGTQLIANLWKINNDPCVWSNHLDFTPEKFLTTHKDVDVKGHHFELLPFGSGRRVCPGISFGLQMIHFILANFLHSFEISNPYNEPVDMSGTIGLVHAKATPLKIMVKPRLSPNCYETM